MWGMRRLVLCAAGLFIAPAAIALSAAEQTLEWVAPMRLFVSGHSLTDRPMLDKLAEMAAGAGRPVVWNMQNIGGSSLEQRSMGSDPERPWSGFKAGMNRNGGSVDVLAEFRQPSVGGATYDVLLVTELHSLLDTIMRQGTVRYLAEYQGRFLETNPLGAIWFMAPWLDVSDKEDPRDWIAYERLALPVWRCAVQAASGAAASGKSTSGIGFIPASLALAELVDHLTSAPRAGFEDMSPEDIVRALFTDTVHSTELGEAYIALIVLATIEGLDAQTVRMPAGVSDAQAQTLKSFAADFLSRYRAEPLDQCSGGISLSFAWAYSGYVGKTYRADFSWPRVAIQRLRDTARFGWNLRNAYSD
ncbi:hypothetical protein GCM10010837_36640 [Aminobacter niigataensis]